MGVARPDFRADVDAARNFARSVAGGIPRRRFNDQHHHAADAVFPARRGLRAALRQKHRHRHARLLDASVFADVSGLVDDFSAHLLDARRSARFAGSLYVPVKGFWILDFGLKTFYLKSEIIGFYRRRKFMQEERDLKREEKKEQSSHTEKEPPETAEHPAPGIKHEREPDAENIMPAEDRPGTF